MRCVGVLGLDLSLWELRRLDCEGHEITLVCASAAVSRLSCRAGFVGVCLGVWTMDETPRLALAAFPLFRTRADLSTRG